MSVSQSISDIPQKFRDAGGYGVLEIWMKKEIQTIADGMSTAEKALKLSYISEMLRDIKQIDGELDAHIAELLDSLSLKEKKETLNKAKRLAKKTWKRVREYQGMIESFGGVRRVTCM